MPSAGPDPHQAERFRQELTALLRASGLVSPDLRIGVALSGGPDSVALLLLAHAAAPGRVFALTADHGLRAEAAVEATAAATICVERAIPHEIAHLTVQETGSGLQAAAREARYQAFAAWARRMSLSVVLTAHHADDQAETMLLRLARGAGLAGLSGIRPIRPLDDDESGPMLARPLLGWRKVELEALVAAAGIEPARDPSNDDTRFDRTVARRLLAATSMLDATRLAASAHHLREADEAIEWSVDRAFRKAVCDDEGDAVLSADYPQEIRRRLLLRVFADCFGKRPDGPAVDRTIRALDRGETVTLADILCSSTAAGWRFRPAPARRSSTRSL